MRLVSFNRYDLGMPLGFVRSANADLGNRKGMLFLYSDGPATDPGEELFHLPKDGLEILCFDDSGALLWSKKLGVGVLPGIWFCPMAAVDMDGDGRDEVTHTCHRRSWLSSDISP